MPRAKTPRIPVFARWFGSWQVRVIKAVLGALPLVDVSFDLAVAAHALEQLPEPLAVLAEMRRALAARGLLRRTRLRAIGHNNRAGTAGQETAA